MNKYYIVIKIIIILFIVLFGVKMINYYKTYQSEWFGFQERTIPVLRALEKLRTSGLLIYGSTIHIDRLLNKNSGPDLSPSESLRKTILSKKLEQNEATHQLKSEVQLIQNETLTFLAELDTYSQIVAKYFPDEHSFMENILASSRSFLNSSNKIIHPDTNTDENIAIAKIRKLNTSKSLMLYHINKAIGHEIQETHEINETMDQAAHEVKNYFLAVVVLYLFSIMAYFLFHRKQPAPGYTHDDYLA